MWQNTWLRKVLNFAKNAQSFWTPSQRAPKQPFLEIVCKLLWQGSSSILDLILEIILYINISWRRVLCVEVISFVLQLKKIILDCKRIKKEWFVLNETSSNFCRKIKPNQGSSSSCLNCSVSAGCIYGNILQLELSDNQWWSKTRKVTEATSFNVF